MNTGMVEMHLTIEHKVHHQRLEEAYNKPTTLDTFMLATQTQVKGTRGMVCLTCAIKKFKLL